MLKAPFPWFGGKSRVAHLVWERFGNVPNYVEPFFGSGAVLLARPHAPGIETVNDRDCLVANFWRALIYDPEAVALYADNPAACLSDPTSGTRARAALMEYLGELAHRMRRVRVCCGDWSRVCGPSPTVKLGTTGVFLDPPYADEADRQDGLYSADDLAVAHKVREWALANGDNPDLRIALCGYEGEHPMPDSWECVAWKARGGYGSQSDGRGRANASRERIWFSPHCLKATLFAEATA